MSDRSAPIDFVFDLESVEARLKPVFSPLAWTKSPGCHQDQSRPHVNRQLCSSILLPQKRLSSIDADQRFQCRTNYTTYHLRNRNNPPYDFRRIIKQQSNSLAGRKTFFKKQRPPGYAKQLALLCIRWPLFPPIMSQSAMRVFTQQIFLESRALIGSIESTTQKQLISRTIRNAKLISKRPSKRLSAMFLSILLSIKNPLSADFL